MSTPSNWLTARLSAWYPHVLLRSFGYHLLLPLLIVVIIVLLSGVGNAFGVRDLIWQEDPVKAGAVGASLGILWMATLFLGYLLWLQDVREERVSVAEADLPPEEASGLGHYTFWVSWLLVATLGLLAVVIATMPILLETPTQVAAEPAAPQPDELPEPFPTEGLVVVLGSFLASWFVFYLFTAYLAAPLCRGLLALLSALPSILKLPGIAFLVACLSMGLWVCLVLLVLPRDQTVLSWVRMAAVIGAAGLTLLAILESSHDETSAAGWFHVLLIGNTLLAYLLVMWLFSQDWRWGWLGILASLLWLPLTLYTFFPATSTSWGQHFWQPAQNADSDEQGWRYTSLVVVLAGGLVYAVLCLLEPTKSPATFVSFFLFGILILYGVFTLFVRRWFAVVLGLLVCMALLASVQPYHFRFDGLSYRPLLDLENAIATEIATQQQLDRLSKDYADMLVKEGYWKKQDALLVAHEDEFAVNDQLRNIQNRCEPLRKQYLETWTKIEKQNRLLPVRLPPEPEGTMLIEWGRLKAPEQPSPLVQVDGMTFQQDQPLVVIAVSGGGLRAAAWTFAVLAELELRTREKKGFDFSRHTRLITGASGGMLGASYYVESLAGAEKRSLEERRADLKKRYDALTEDCLTPVMQQFILGDVPSFFSPWYSSYDRGKALEDAWSHHLKGTLDRPFADFAEAERRGERPFLAFTPMLVEDGRRLLVSNLDLRQVLTNDGNLIRAVPAGTVRRPTDVFSRDALELFRLFPEARSSFKLSTAVRMSASFPFFSPAVSIPTRPRRRVVDAGYYDNYGVSLAAAWLFSGRNTSAFAKVPVNRFVLIQIRDGVSDAQRALEKTAPDPSHTFGRALEEVTSPIEGLYNSREGSSSFRNDGQLELLSQYLGRGTGLGDTSVPRFVVVNLELAHSAPLSWFLGSSVRNNIWTAAGQQRYRDIIDELLRWWDLDRANPL